MNELISIIVPVYNVETYLDRCVYSLVNQKYSNIEIILVDDGSTDKSGKKCDKWRMLDKRIRCIHKKNGGLSDARNVGLEVARGDYIGFVDSDDWIDLNMFSLLYKYITSSKSDIAICGIFLSDGKFQKVYKRLSNVHYYDNELALKEILLEKNIDVSMCNKLYKKECFDNVRFPVNENNEDAIVTIELFSNIFKAVHVGKPMYYYFQRESSISNTYSKKNLSNYCEHTLQIEDIIKKRFDSLFEYANAYVLNQIITILKCLFKENDISQRTGEVSFYSDLLKKYNIKETRKLLTFKRKILLFLINLKLNYVNEGSK